MPTLEIEELFTIKGAVTPEKKAPIRRERDSHRQVFRGSLAGGIGNGHLR